MINKTKSCRMKLLKLKSYFLWKDSCTWAMGVITALETILAVANFDLLDICLIKWYVRLLIIILFYVVLSVIIAVIKACKANKKVTFKIRGISVIIREGDIFKENGWLVIPFNEFFDTQVDDIVIARNTLNGKLITNYIEDLNDLKIAIKKTKDTPNLQHSQKRGRKCYPLGKIIPYKQYLLLAFTHFENNVAYLNHNDYEKCLRTMWQEIDRVYANQPVVLPLLGSGITRFYDICKKNNFHLLRCMLCTLKTSKAQLNQPITIVLTRQILDEINLYELKKLC